MKIDIQSPHFTPAQKLTKFVMDKVSKLSHLHSRIIAAEVCLKLESHHVLQNKICEIRLIIPGNDLFSKKQSLTFEDATDQAVDALKAQIRKHKTESYGEELDPSKVLEDVVSVEELPSAENKNCKM